MILYLHGFRSSPQSYKARLLAQELQQRQQTHLWQCPQLPASPAAAIALCHQLIQSHGTAELCIIGSSLGGYYASHLAQHYGSKAVLLNPVVHAARDLATQVGSHQSYHSDTPFHFLPNYVQELAHIVVPRPTKPELFYLLAAKGDEVLDWREMVDWYQHSHITLIEGSDHGLSDFPLYIQDVLNYALPTS